MLVTLDKWYNVKIMENRNDITQSGSSHIDISQQAEIQQWAEKLNVPEEILKDAVRAAGTTVEEVMEHLNENPPSREITSKTSGLPNSPRHEQADSREDNRNGKEL